MSDRRNERAGLIEQLQNYRRSRVLCYLTSDRPNAAVNINKDVIPLFFDHLRKMDGVDRIDVLLFTSGGDTLAAFGLARLLREFSPWIGTLVPARCHSAGTLFALGANEILMTRLATLSPFDPSISGPLNPAVQVPLGQVKLVPLSVESVAGYRALIQDHWGISDQSAIGAAFKILAEKVHPLALGDVYRATQQIELLATKLISVHRADKESIDRIVQTLTKRLGSHDYLISRAEARELLGAQVARDDPAAEDLIWKLHQSFAEEMKLGLPYDASIALREARASGSGSAGQKPHVVQKLAFIESLEGTHVCEKEVELSTVAIPPPMPGLPPDTGVREELVRAGWTFQNH